MFARIGLAFTLGAASAGGLAWYIATTRSAPVAAPVIVLQAPRAPVLDSPTPPKEPAAAEPAAQRVPEKPRTVPREIAVAAVPPHLDVAPRDVAPRDVAPPAAPFIDTRPAQLVREPDAAKSSPPLVPALVTPPEPKSPRVATLPAGTLITVRLRESLSTKTNTTGDTFQVTLDQPIVVNELVIAERGSIQLGKVVGAEQPGRVKGRAGLTLELVELKTADGQRVAIRTESFRHEIDSDTRGDVTKAGIAAGIGAAIGAIAGGGTGAAIGAGIGGAAGAGGVLMTRGKEARLESETRITFRVAEPVMLTETTN